LELIESNNKNWNDLFYDLISESEIKDLKELIKERKEEPGFQLSLE
jgi:hypothetical protein